MPVKPKISFAICVGEESHSFVELIDFLKKYKKAEDEIVVISDFSKSVKIKECIKKVDKHIFRKLLNDFASHKNIFFSLCKNEYIFNLDSDELPSEYLIKNIHNLIAESSHDLYWIPRLNYFTGVGDDEIKKMGMSIDKDKNNAVNFPDYQGRIYRNDKKLKWKRKLHEQINGATNSKKLKYSDGYYITHTKTKNNLKKSKTLYKNLINYNPPISSLGVVCCYFNPCNYKSKFLNFVKFLNSIEATGINPLVIEAYSDNSLHRIYKLTDSVISIKTDSIFWKKEQLLNIGIDALLKKKYEYIAWVDADITFNENDWWKQVIVATEFYGVVQIFANSVKQKVTPALQHKHSSAYMLSHTNTEHDLQIILSRKNEPGYGHCYHRSFLEKNNLYDLSIIGGGDILNLIGFYYNEQTHKTILNDRFFSNMTDEFKQTYVEWCKRNKKVVNGIGYANVDITVLFHGNKSDRKYVTREHILSKHRYNPITDLSIKDKVYQIKKLSIKNEIYNHFLSRNEDVNLTYSDLELVSKIKQMMSTSKLDFIQNEIYSHINNKHIKNKLSDYVITDEKRMLVAVRSAESLFSINRIPIPCKILIDGNVSPCLNSFTNFKNHGPFGIFLQFICTFYEELPRVVYFTHNQTNVDLYSNFIKIFEDNYTEFNPVVGKLRILHIDQHTKIKNYRTLRVWYKETINKAYDEKYKTFVGSCFSIPRTVIHKKPISFYATTLRAYKQYPEKEEYMLKFAFYSLFQ